MGEVDLLLGEIGDPTRLTGEPRGELGDMLLLLGEPLRSKGDTGEATRPGEAQGEGGGARSKGGRERRLGWWR